jgi:hypothetical protein
MLVKASSGQGPARPSPPAWIDSLALSDDTKRALRAWWWYSRIQSRATLLKKDALAASDKVPADEMREYTRMIHRIGQDLRPDRQPRG